MSDIEYMLLPLRTHGYMLADVDMHGNRELHMPSELDGRTINIISTGALSYNLDVREIIFPHGLELIQSNACSYMYNLRFVFIPKSVSAIENCAFTDCMRLEDVIFENGIVLSEIGSSAFARSSLNDIAIPPSVRKIGEGAFFKCEELTDITLCGGITEIEDNAFAGCDSLKTINFMGNEMMWYNIKIGDGNEALYRADIVFMNDED